MAKVVLYNNCNCVVTTEEALPMVTDFFTGMSSGGTNYNPNEKDAINKLVEDILFETGAEQVAFRENYAAFPQPGDLGVLYIDQETKRGWYWNGASYQYLFSEADFTFALKAKLEGLSINGELLDPSGSIILGPEDIGADPEGTAEQIFTAGMAAHIAEADPHTQYVLDTEKAQPLGLATLDSNGKLLGAQVPDIAISEYLGTAANQAAMLALQGQKGDWVTRMDTGTNWIITGDNPSQIGSWTQLSYPASPVISVNGKQGAVTITKADIGLDQVDNTSDAAKPVSTAQQTALNLKESLSNKAINLTSPNDTKYPSVKAVTDGLALKENSITAGTALQYWAGNKTWQTTPKEAISGRIIYVDKDSTNSTDTRTGLSKYSMGAPFRTIQAALNAASTNDIINIAPSATTHDGDLTLDVNGYGGNQAITLILNNTTINGNVRTANINYGIINIIGAIGTNIINGNVGGAYAIVLGQFINLTVRDGVWGTSNTSTKFSGCTMTFATSTNAPKGTVENSTLNYTVGWATYSIAENTKYINCDFNFAASVCPSAGGLMNAPNIKVIFDNCRINIGGVFFDDCRQTGCLFAFRNCKIAFGSYLVRDTWTNSYKIVFHKSELISSDTGAGKVVTLATSPTTSHTEFLNTVRNVPIGGTATIVGNDAQVTSITNF